MFTNQKLHDKTFVISLVSATSFIIIALALGIADNPPGILFMFAAAFSLVLAMVNQWRTPRRFMKMTLVSLAGFPILVVLHNALDVFANRGPGWLEPLMTGFSGTAFILAVIVCPVAFLGGLIGFGMTYFLNRNG